jgi:diguanylate cyclase (GGDEF)-like protein
MTISTKETKQFPSQHNRIEWEKMMVELENLKRQSERLDLINKLHARMAGVLNLSAMIEAYSVWLMPLVNHELIGYSNSRRNMKHLFCSGHGPERRQILALAEKLIHGNGSIDQHSTDKNGHRAYKWVFETAEEEGVFLIIKEGNTLSEKDIDLITDSLDILAENLQRGLEYEELFLKATNDALTGLSNRRVFEDRIDLMVSRAKRYGHPLTMISMDLDNFKMINDILGHHAGDEALKAVAAVFKKMVRHSDLLVRMGGDEFLIVLEQTDLKSARVLAERLCVAVNYLNIWANETTKLGVSVGLSQLKEGESLKQWLERTDDILYHAKARGRSRVCVE